MLDEFLRKNSTIQDEDLYEEDIELMAGELLDKCSGSRVKALSKILEFFLDCEDEDKKMTILDIGRAVNVLTPDQKLIPITH